MASNDEKKIREIINNFSQMIPEIDLNMTAPQITEGIQDMIKREIGVKDPYKRYKEDHIKKALNVYSKVKEIIEKADNTIEAALVMAATGNSIDAGVNLDVDINSIINYAINDGFTYSDIEEFNEELKKGKGVKLLIIGDNSGEAVFDKLLIEELNKYGVDIVYAVREEPILNDVTMVEAKEIGLDKVCHLISSGSRAPGMLIDEASKEFMNFYNKADIIISKGQGNYEALSDEKRSIFFLLRAKCNVIAREFGLSEGSLIFKLNRNSK